MITLQSSQEEGDASLFSSRFDRHQVHSESVAVGSGSVQSPLSVDKGRVNFQWPQFIFEMTTYLQTNDAVTAVRQHSRTWRPGGSKLFRTALSLKVLGQFNTNQMVGSKRTLTWEPAAPAAPWFPFGPMATGPVTVDAIVAIASANAPAYMIPHVKTLKTNKQQTFKFM